MTKEEAIETIQMAIAKVEWEYPMNYAVAFDMAIDALRAQAEAEKNGPLTVEELREMDVEPVRHGRWIEDGDYIICPECRKPWNVFDNDTYMFKRCPNCGAKMENL